MTNIGEMCEVENRYITPTGHYNMAGSNGKHWRDVWGWEQIYHPHWPLKHGWGLMANIGEMCEVENRYITPTGQYNMAGV